ncbi:MAG TPA: galactitol-1-phosphate 5-dehydrogenase [Patescibacteria group bacterium]|nr:galactitol-1-phosphate 5-dehydrogenase [Patescibacteria group bacterium]
MKAAVLEGQGVLAYREVPTPEPAAGEVLLEVRASAICGSDIHRFARGHRTYPMILGHEAAGVIVAAGAGADPTLVGRRAALVPLVPCHACAECLIGRYSACGGYSFIGSRRAGALAQHVALPARNVLLLPDDLPFEAAALIEPATVARHMLDLGSFRAGQSAAVFGAGSIGLMLVQWLRILGAGPVIATDLVDANLAVAATLGAQVTLNAGRDDVPAEVLRRTGIGVDLVLEASGSPAALAQVVKVARPRGSVVLGGNQPPDASLPMALIESLMRRELSLTGCFMSYSAPWPGHEWADSLAAALDGGLDMAAMISHRAPLAEAPAIFEELGAHRLAHRKIVFDPTDQRSP